jgi:tetraacyldisaccharide 4'-kinase
VAVAFAGIAKPETFFESLRRLGIHLPVCFHFPDHYPYGENDALLLLESTLSERAHFLITTEKDVVRLPASLQSAVLSAELEVDFGQERDAFCSFLDKSLNDLTRNLLRTVPRKQRSTLDSPHE